MTLDCVSGWSRGKERFRLAKGKRANSPSLKGRGEMGGGRGPAGVQEGV